MAVALLQEMMMMSLSCLVVDVGQLALKKGARSDFKTDEGSIAISTHVNKESSGVVV